MMVPLYQVVLQQRSKHKDTHPGLWDVSAAGHITGDDEVVTTGVRSPPPPLVPSLSN